VCDELSVRALDRAFELAGKLGALMHDALAARGLTVTQAHILYALDQRGPLMQRELADELSCTPRHVTALVDALEARRLVQRAPHPTDRRATLVSLAADGLAATARMRSERELGAQALLAGADATQLEGFITTSGLLLDRIEALVSGSDANPSRTPSAEEEAAGGRR
jgi:DNA-binding MarR family transcriptional regulator